MMLVACRGRDARRYAKGVEESLRRAGLEGFELEARSVSEPGFAGAALPAEEAVYVGVFARACLREDEEGVKVYDHECGLEAVERGLAKLLAALENLAGNEWVGLAAITNVPGIWPWWGPLTADSPEESVKLYALYVARDAPRTALEDSLLRTLLARENLRSTPSPMSFAIGAVPFVDVESLAEALALDSRRMGGGLLIVVKHPLEKVRAS